MKNKYRFLDVPSIKAMGLEADIPKIVGFLVKNPNIKMMGDTLDILKNIDSHITTPMYDVYTSIFSDVSQWDKLSILSLLDTDIDIPTPLLSTDIIINPKESLRDDFASGMVSPMLNVSPYITKTRTAGIGISSVPELQSALVRLVLCATFYQDDNWLPMNALEFIVESYTIAMSLNLSQAYNLTAEEVVELQTYIAHVFSLKCTTSVIELEDLVYSPILNRCGFLGSINDITGRLSKITTHVSDNKSPMENLFAILASGVIPKLNSVSLNVLYVVCPSGLSNDMSKVIAVDYPPYWAHMLLKSASSKSILISKIMKSPTIKKKFSQFVEIMARTEFKLED